MPLAFEARTGLNVDDRRQSDENVLHYFDTFIINPDIYY